MKALTHVWTNCREKVPEMGIMSDEIHKQVENEDKLVKENNGSSGKNFRVFAKYIHMCVA